MVAFAKNGISRNCRSSAPVEPAFAGDSRQSLTPSLILSGPEGVGKRLTAISIAQELNCLSPVDGTACGTCTVCGRIARGAHPDVMTIEPGENGSIKIEQVRDAIDRAVYRPFEGRRRVTIVRTG